MKTITMLHFRRNASAVLRRIARGERLVLSYRGKPVAGLEPLGAGLCTSSPNDLFLTIGNRAIRSPKGKIKHGEIDRILYDRD